MLAHDDPIIRAQSPENIKGVLLRTAQVKRKFDEPTFGQVAVHFVVEVLYMYSIGSNPSGRALL